MFFIHCHHLFLVYLTDFWFFKKKLLSKSNFRKCLKFDRKCFSQIYHVVYTQNTFFAKNNYCVAMIQILRLKFSSLGTRYLWYFLKVYFTYWFFFICAPSVPAPWDDLRNEIKCLNVPKRVKRASGVTIYSWELVTGIIADEQEERISSNTYREVSVSVVVVGPHDFDFE